MLRKYYISPELAFVVQQDAARSYGKLGQMDRSFVPFRKKNPELCIDKKLARSNMQLTLANYGGHHDVI